MGTDAVGFGALNSLVLILLFGVVLLVEWPTRWRGQAAVKGQAKVPRPLGLKTGKIVACAKRSRRSVFNEGGRLGMPWPWREILSPCFYLEKDQRGGLEGKFTRDQGLAALFGCL